MPGVSAVVTVHKEGLDVIPSIKSAIHNSISLQNSGVDSEVVVVLDRPDELTSKVILDQFSKCFIHFVDFGDPSLTRNFAVSVSKYDYIAFLDGDDVWGSKWLSTAYKLQSKEGEKYSIWHPQFNFYFSCEPHQVGRNLLVEQISSEDPRFDPFLLASQNYWTVLSFGHKKIFESLPFEPNCRAEKNGFEDWTFNVAAIKSGFQHKIVSDTIHFIREKSSTSVSKSHLAANSVFIPKDIWFT